MKNKILYILLIFAITSSIFYYFELKEIKTQLNRIEFIQSRVHLNTLPNNSRNVELNFAEGFAIGDSSAPVQLALFLDYQCGYCKFFFDETYPKLYEEFISTGVVRFVIKDFPLKSHANAFLAAQFANCAQQSSKYEQYRTAVFNLNGEVTINNLNSIAINLGIDVNACTQDTNISNIIQNDLNTGREMGVSGTPTFVINKNLFVGNKPYNEFRSIIIKELKSKGNSCN